MMRPDAKVEKVCLFPKPVDFRKIIFTSRLQGLYSFKPVSTCQHGTLAGSVVHGGTRTSRGTPWLAASALNVWQARRVNKCFI